MTAPGGSSTLRRTLGFGDLVMLTFGTVIGSGIFLVPGVVLRQTDGRVGVAGAVWVVAGILSLLGALTYAELGAMRPEAGGLYAYIRDAFGPLPAFLYGWTSFLVIASGSVAALSVAFSNYLGQLVTLGPVAAKAVSVAVIIVIAAVNVRGARHSANLQNWTTGAKVGGLLVLSIGLIALGKGWSTSAASVAAPSSTSIWVGVGAAMIGVLWAYEGWQYVTFSAGETRDPQRVFPRAIALATFGLVVLYLLANVGYVMALGPAATAQSSRVAAEAMAAVFGPTSGKFLSMLVLLSIFSAANGLMLTTPRMYYAMAHDGVFFKRLANVHPRFGTPAFAIIALAVWSAVLAASGTFDQLLTYVVFVGWIFYGLGAMAVFVFRRTEPSAARPFKTPGYPVTPILFVASAVALVLNTVVTQPIRGAIGIGAVLIGTPAFYAWRARSRRSVAGIAVVVIASLLEVGSAGAQLPPSIEFRVAKPPTLAVGDSTPFLGYELHVTNLTPAPWILRRVEVLDGANPSRVLATLQDSALVREMGRLGPSVPAAERSTIAGGLRGVVYLWLPFPRGDAPATLRHRLTVERATDSTKQQQTLEGGATRVDRNIVVVSPPLRGDWAALNGPSNSSGHRRLVLALNGELASAQRFAMDLLRIDETGKRMSGDPLKNESYFAYGQEALAVADGKVVVIKDGIPQNVPGANSRAVPITLETVGGNHVVIDIGGGHYAFYAHVQPGSIRVKVGDKVKRGQVLALVGNSGNSTEPHLHFHIVDGIAPGTSTLGAEGVPYAIEQFEVLGSCPNPGAGCARTTSFVARRAIPLQNEIVRFK